MLRLLPLLLLPWLPLAAAAVIIDSGDGTGNTTAPSPDPGWDHVGARGSLTAVYLDNGWVISSDHGFSDDVVLGGVTYTLVPGSEVQVINGDGSDADLLLFAITPEPPLPPLPIASSTPSNGASVIAIGYGKNRGPQISCNPPGPGSYDGYDWAAGRTKRWGTNFVEDFDTIVLNGRTTDAFGSIFDEAGSTHEGQAATGDSGGAAFVWNGSQWELAGVLFAVNIVPGCQENLPGQDPTSTLYTQTTWAADLSVYQTQILDVISMPEPSGGLAAGAALLGVLARRRRTAGGAASKPA